MGKCLYSASRTFIATSNSWFSKITMRVVSVFKMITEILKGQFGLNLIYITLSKYKEITVKGSLIP